MTTCKPIKILLLLWVLNSIGLAACEPNFSRKEPAPPELAYGSDLQGAIEGVLNGYPQYELGISAAVSAPGYKTWAGASGYSHQDVPVTTDMLFDVGSVLKNFEAALALKLVEEGQLSLDEPISTYLPAYPHVDGDITVRQLLDHSSGVYNVFEHPEFPWARTGIDYARKWAPEEVFDNFVLEPYGPSGYAQHYSSTNYLLLTLLLKEVTGECVPKEIERHFMDPLALLDTFVSMGALPPGAYPVAHPWVDLDGDGVFEDLYGIPRYWIASLTHPVMFSTPSDLVRWTQALYHERTVLSDDSLEAMLTYPQTTLRDPDGVILGLGVVDYSELLGMPVIGHGGSSLGYSAAALYLPEYGVSVATLINTGESPVELANQLMSAAWTELSEVIKSNQQ